jgi:hypothetical protein
MVGTLLFFGFNKIKSAHKPETNIYTHIPKKSFAIIDITSPIDQWQDLLSNNIIWDQLLTFDQIQSLKEHINLLDSAFAQNKHISPPSQLIISIITDSTNENHIAFQFRISNQINQKQFFESITELFHAKKKIGSTTNRIELQTDLGIVHILFKDHIVTLSPISSILNDVDFQIENNISLLQDSLFTTVHNTSSKNSIIRLLVKPNRLLEHFDQLTNSKTQAQITTLPSISNWIELDCEIKPDEINMNGFTIASDTLHNWISIFKDQDPISPKVIDFLPNRTALLMHYGFSDFQKLRSEYIKNKTLSSGFDPNRFIHEWDTAYDISIKNDFLNWIDNEIALVIAEPDRLNFSNDMMVWISSNDSRTAFQLLTEMSTKIATKKDLDLNIIDYKEFRIVQMNLPDFLATTIGDPFQDIRENYFVQIDDYIVFANSPATLQWTIDQIQKDLVLINDPHYQSFANRVSNESNLYLYSNIAQSPNIYSNLVNTDLKSKIYLNKEWIQKFQVFSVQISYESDDLYYVNSYLKYNPVYKKESNSLWETSIQSSSQFKPQFVNNHYTQATEIFTQDTNNIIYLIDNKGNILWNKQIDAPIISKVKQIDALKNGKLQLAFNTTSSLYIIDRNGNNLKHFPIKLPATSSTSMTIADYDLNLNYRFLIPCIDGHIYNYGIDGNLISGWKYKKTSSIVNHPLTHFKIKGKDYILATYDNGSNVALDRKGDLRINLKSTFNFKLIGDPYVQVNSDIENSYLLGVTQQNEIVKINFNDHKTRLFSVSQDSVTHIAFKNIDDDGSIEIIFTSPHMISAYKTDGNKVFEFETLVSCNYSSYVYKFNNNYFIGYSSYLNNEIYLTDFTGHLIHSFPLKGATPFSISDINNDGRYNLVTTDNEGVVYTYTLEL